MSIEVIHGDMREVLGKMIAEGKVVQSIVTDPPYGLEFMGKEWDAPWQVSSKSALFGDRKTKMPGWGFAGSGTTGMACMAEGFDCILVEREAEYVADIKARIAHVHGDDTPLFSGAML